MLRPLLLSPSLILWRFLVLDLLNVVLLLLFFHWIYLEILVRLRKRHVNLMSLLVWILLYILLIHISIEYLVLAWCWNELLVVWRHLRICHSVWRIVVSSSWVWNYRWGSFAVELILGHAVLAHHWLCKLSCLDPDKFACISFYFLLLDLAYYFFVLECYFIMFGSIIWPCF